MTSTFDTDVVVTGAGHAGLAASYHLQRLGRAHVVLDRDGIGATWRTRRWDSFTLVTPNWTLDLPGHPYEGSDPDGFEPRDGVVAYLRRYAERYRLPVEEGVEVTRVAPEPAGGFVLETSRGALRSRAVVVATGFFQHPRVPAAASDVPRGIAQLHATEYERPEALPEGAVLVVGSGQSGSQIAEELLSAGRRVFLSTGRAGRAPRRYRGRDVMRWVAELGLFEQRVGDLESSAMKFAANPHVSGARGGHTINLHRLARDGATLLGRFAGVDRGVLRFAGDLHENLAAADAFADGLRSLVDDYVRERGLDAPPPDPDDDHEGREGFERPGPPALDPDAEGLAAVVWANGFSFDYSWIDVPGLVDADGYPVHANGAGVHPGLYFVGLHFQTRAASDLFVGVGADALEVAVQVDELLRARAAIGGVAEVPGASEGATPGGGATPTG